MYIVLGNIGQFKILKFGFYLLAIVDRHIQYNYGHYCTFNFFPHKLSFWTLLNGQTILNASQGADGQD